MEANYTRERARVFHSKRIIGIIVLLVAMILLLIPVKTQYTDPCGSVIFSEKVTFVENGQIKNAVTPPCSDAHKKRMLWGVPMAGLGLILIGFSIFSGKEDEDSGKETQKSN